MKLTAEKLMEVLRANAHPKGLYTYFPRYESVRWSILDGRFDLGAAAEEINKLMEGSDDN